MKENLVIKKDKCIMECLPFLGSKEKCDRCSGFDMCYRPFERCAANFDKEDYLLNKGQKVHYEWLEKGDFKNIEQDVVKK
jgi:hypothetical protein